MAARESRPSAEQQLVAFFHRNGYVRRFDPKRRAEEGQNYKKGDEFRLVAESKSELAAIRRLLKQCGFNPGRPFTQGRQYRQPVYGRAAVSRFASLVAAQQGAAADVKTAAQFRRG